MGALSQQQSITPPNTRPGTEQHAPLLSTTTVSNRTLSQKQVPTTSSTQQLNTSAPLAPIPQINERVAQMNYFLEPLNKKKDAREELSNTVDLLTLKYLDNFSSAEKELNQSTENFKEEDPDMLFLKSLHSSLTKLPKRQNRRARIKMQQVLFELEGSDDDL